ncbi:S-adenosyl-methyltransferase MraW [Lactobacillus selangorensis]|uniref:Ribosomal RNA small subunit methyltransferase H n=1 Tax=Lactobacillus selangorensis TaxID=81857 RepID=A0A0R2G008_9LACO|nr:16S rRNA (cytosine(1402)-N(4))-methyltransferase RsmH [Lactobacillus selangorensis]KRN29357.1 S-adenosyl-methyltransferase MraW [Lactobacillus selangorensis]KRN34114.1 S-adenosyl-methyltransferase MraW [Lactobacillus selangorensis]
MAYTHETVLLAETVDGLNVKPDGIYVDATLGLGGHSEYLAKQLTTGHLYSFDQDQKAIDSSAQRLQPEIAAGTVTLIHDNFRNLKAALAQQGVTALDGILYDLGVSSPQFDDASRGFSYRFEAPLDMRMNQEQELTAYEVVNKWSYQDLVRIFYRYSDEKFAKPIARKIERERAKAPIETTTQLAALVKSAIPAAARRTGGFPAKRVFQAVRIAVNDELGAIEDSLEEAIDLLKLGGRISVITFQPQEDRITKHIFKEHASMPDVPQGLPVIPKDQLPELKIITKKPILPSETETEKNHRAHSARLRIAEKVNQK